jgi:hypothetical protein
MELIRTAGENHHQDVMAFRKGVKWGAERLSDELDERARLAQARTIMLSVRVLDGFVRELVNEVKGQAGSIALSRSKAEGDAALERLAATFQKLNERIGQLLREMDDLPS